MRNFEVQTKYLRLPENGELRLSYYIITDETVDTDSTGSVLFYGVGISTEKEDAHVRAITSDAEKIEKLVNTLAKNHVTPMCLKDVITDLF